MTPLYYPSTEHQDLHPRWLMEEKPLREKDLKIAWLKGTQGVFCASQRSSQPGGQTLDFFPVSIPQEPYKEHSTLFIGGDIKY